MSKFGCSFGWDSHLQDTLARLTLWQKLGQSFNASGIGFFAKVALVSTSSAITLKVFNLLYF